MGKSFVIVAVLAGVAVSHAPTLTSASSKFEQIARPGAKAAAGAQHHASRIHTRHRVPDGAVSDVIIEVGTTTNMSCAGSPVVCMPTGAGAILSTRDLKTYLATSNVIVTTAGGGGSANGDITVAGKINWAASTALTIDSYHSITVNKLINVRGSGSSAGLALTTNDGGTGGTLLFGSGASAIFWDTASTLTINGSQPYTLINSVNSNTNTLAVLAQQVADNPVGSFALGAGYDAGNDNPYAGAVVQAPFSGRLEGLGNTISNLSSQFSITAAGAGLLYTVGTSGPASISDISLTGMKVTGESPENTAVGGLLDTDSGAQPALLSGDSVSGSIRLKGAGACNFLAVGGLVGQLTNESGMISNSRSSVKIHVQGPCDADVGGLIGQDGSAIQNSFAKGSVTYSGGAPTVDIGGLAGAAEESTAATIKQSHATGAVVVTSKVSHANAGGLVGFDTMSIDGSFATGDVTTTSNLTSAGGLIGLLESSGVGITNTFATGSISSTVSNGGSAFAGGLVGYEVSNNTNYYQYVFATGNVTATAPAAGRQVVAGGLIGRFAFKSIVQAYASGIVSADGGTSDNEYGGFLGEQYESCGKVRGSYWDVTNTTDGVGYMQGCTYDLNGLTTSEFTAGLPPEFDPDVWTESSTLNNGFPYLIANPPPQ